jgi:anti-sigma28 factor (negative regulator of flagellin synthesis)
MTIDKVSSFLFARSIARQQEGDRKTGTKDESVITDEVARTDSVVISQKSTLLREMDERGDDERLTKVSKLKQLISSGAYTQPSGGALARAIISEMG